MMPALIPGFEYDVFISYRHKDNKGGHWVTAFVDALKTELEATFKEDISIYFDENPHDGLLETHNVDKSLERKLRCLIFIPILSKTYCDPKSFAWQHEFCEFNRLVKEDQFGKDVRLSNGNFASRILPVKIHDLDGRDKATIEAVLAGVLRSIDFIYKAPGVNRPLVPSDSSEINLNKSVYRDQINKTANAIREILIGIETNEAPSVQVQTSKIRIANLPYELKRRNVLRAGLAYLFIAVVLWKIMSIAADTFNLGEKIVTAVSIALIILFPFAVLMSWLYERSPSGFIRSGSADSFSNPFTPDQRKPLTSNVFLILLLITAAGLFIIFPPDTKATDKIDDPSVAVVPFDNLNKDPSQDYISDGMMEAILSHLNKIEGLRLTSRTTMMTYKATNKTIREIAEEVGVRFVLEGSVQRVGNTIRINAQLIDGQTDEHIWSEYYDRTMAGLLNVQSEVAQSIAGKLSVQIRPITKAHIEGVPTNNPEAYELYLKATQLEDDGSVQHRDLLQKALGLDPRFSQAYAALAWHWILQGFVDFTSQKVIQTAEPLLNKALMLDPDNVRAHVCLGFLNLWHKWDFYAAEREFNYARQLEPSNPVGIYSDVQVSMGKFDEAVELVRLGVAAEPNNIHGKINLGFAFYLAGKHEEAMAWIDSARTTADPLHPAYGDLGRIYFYNGQYDRVLEVNKKIEGSPRYVLNTRLKAFSAMALLHLGQHESADKILDEIMNQIKNGPVGSPAFHAAMIYAQKGEKDLAFQYLDKAYDAHEIEMYWAGVEPPFEPLRKDPRWQIVLDRIGFPEAARK